MTPKTKQIREKLKQYLSGFLIFAILFGQTVHVPLLEITKAAAAEYPNLVAILVPESEFSGDLKSALKRYGDDVQANLDGSRAAIVTIPDDATPDKIAAVLERLYYEGDGEGNSRLVGTLLVGNLPFPVVHRGNKTFLSVTPYVDFVDKSFVYKPEKAYYEFSDVPAGSDTPEIWHGIVRSNTGDSEQDTERLVAFFDKTHEYYAKNGRYEASKFLPEPYVFYFDAYHDQLSSRPAEWKAYNLMLKYAEDLAYNRYNKHLAKTVYEAYQSYVSSDVPNASGTEIGKILEENGGSDLDFSNAPDVQTREPIEKSLKRFFEVMNEKYLGDILRYVHNAGRYGIGNEVRADIPATVVGKGDEFMKRSLKDANRTMEEAIDAIVRGGLARHVAVGLTYTVDSDNRTADEKDASGAVVNPGVLTSKYRSYRNFLYGREGALVGKAEDCTIVRGSTLPVEANRGYNALNSQGDVALLQADRPGGGCFPGGNIAAGAFWGNNSPLKLDVSQSAQGVIKLKSNYYDGFIKSIFDIGGSKEITPGGDLPIATPNDCTKRRLWILDPFVETDEFGSTVGFPPERMGQPIACTTDTVNNSTKPDTFDNYYTKGFPNESCTIHHLRLDGAEVKTVGSWCEYADGAYDHIDKTYSYKKVLSVMEHKSPTDWEYGEELKSFVTPSLPTDKDRYVDFISARGNYSKIVYPNLFRISIDNEDDLTLDKARELLKQALDQKSAEVNAMIASETPAGGLYDLLKNGAYPTGKTIDLYASLSADPGMLDSVTNAILWNNLSNATAKYAYVLEHHLDVDGNANYPIPGHKSDYEISYLVGKGDARNMYVKLDPASKEGPGGEIGEILQASAQQLAAIDAANLSSGKGDEKAEFKCGPPDGVPLPQWLPAIFCWLGTILPPTVSAGSCAPNSPIDVAEIINKHFSKDTNGNGVPDYQEDSDANGIMDGAEYLKDGKIELQVAPARVPYSETVALAASLNDKNGIRIVVDNLNEVSFDISKIVAYSGGTGKEVYRRGASGELGNVTNTRPYVNFGQVSVRAVDGRATFTLTSKDRDADVYFDATVSPRDKNGKAAFIKTSEEAKLEIRSESLKIGLSASGSSISTYLKAGEFPSVTFPIKKVGKGGMGLSVTYPVAYSVIDDDTGNPLGITGSVASGDLSYDGRLLNQTGNHRFEFVDKDGVVGSQVITVTSGIADKIELTPSSTLFVKNETVTVVAKVVDKYGNLVKGDLITLQGSLKGGGYFLENKASEIEKTIVEGYATFEASTSDGGKNLTFDLKTKDGKYSASTNFRSLDYAKAVVEIADRSNVVVGKAPHTVNVKIVDAAGTVLQGFDGVAAVSFPEFSGVLDSNFVAIKDGKTASGFLLTPKYVAGKKLTIDVRVPGVKDVEGNEIDVLPDVPMRVALETEKPAMEAKPGETETVTARIFDRYGNLAYNHPDNAIAAKFSVPSEYRKYLRLPGNAFSSETKFSGGVATTTVGSTRLPGTPYLVVEVTPGLESNSFAVTDKSGSTVIVSGYSKNAVVIDTYYLWNKSKIDKIQYNGLYTVISGADYGNFTERDYLGGEILFNPDSRSLAVTAQLNDAVSREKVFSVTPGGKTELPESESLVKAEVSSVAGRTSVGFYDPFYKEYVARAYFNVSDEFGKIACKNDDNQGIDNCEVPTNAPFVVLKGFGDATAVSQNGLALVKDGLRILEIDADGAVSKLPNVRLEVDKENSRNLFAVKVIADNRVAGYLAIKLRSDDVVLTKPAELQSVLASQRGKVVVETVSSRYFPLPVYLGNSSRGSKGMAFYSTRESDGATADRDMIGGTDTTGFEEFRDKQGIGWENQNKTLLEFAGGSSVGEATRFNSSYSTVNLGDPVFRVAKPKNEGNYDRTLGIRLMDAENDDIESYRKFDFNADGYDDLVVFLSSGKIRLFANLKGSLKDMGYLAYVADAGKARKAVGDFAGDGYWDIVAVDKDGALILIDNREGKFIRKTAPIFNSDGTASQLRGRIVQLETFDMDADGKTDLVISDESGELNVLYGGTNGGETAFTKKLLDNSLALRISSADRTDGGAVYFDGLPQLSNPSIADQAKYLAESDALAGSEETGDISPAVKTAAIDAKIYYVHAYEVPVEYTGGTVDSQVESRLAKTIGNDPDNPSQPNSALMDQVLSAMSDAESLAASGSFTKGGTYPETRHKTFLRSPYAQDRDVKIVKNYEDVNSDPLKTGDPVKITVTITNQGTSSLKNVAYLDYLERKLFTEGEAPTYRIEAPGLTKTGALESLANSSYDFLFDGFSLNPGDTATISYSVQTLPVSFGKFMVGKLEEDDVYGDVAMRANNICGEAMTLWKSVQPYPRSYEKTTRTFEGTNGTAGGLAGKFIDSNGNGTPDYVDILSNPSVDPSNPNKHSYDIGLPSYDAATHGPLLFREIVDPVTGTVNSANIEIARLVANAANKNLQRTSEPDAGDVPVPVAADAVQGTYSASSKTISAGSLVSETVSGALACGSDGYRTVKAPVLKGWKQVADAPNGNLQMYFTTGTHSKDGGKTTVACNMEFSSSSNPTWSGNRVVGEGWKILTQNTYSSYALAAKNADFRNSSSNVPDDYDQAGSDLYSYGLASGQFSADGLSEANVEAISANIDQLVRSLGCGFGGGACLSMPMNWAPLAPGTAPSAFGFPLTSLSTGTGIPLFSVLTGMPVGPYCVPTIFPVSPLDLAKSCGGIGAGGYLGDASATNFFRFYLTPTITGAIGIAACYGPLAKISGRIPPAGVSPIVPGGNCVVAAKPFLGCKDDGSDGNVGTQGYFGGNNRFYNSQSCTPKSGLRPLTDGERQLVRQYVRGNQGKSVVDGITAALPYVTSGPGGIGYAPTVGIGLSSGQDPNFTVGIDPTALKNFDTGNIVKMRLDRVSAFPDFIMDWVNRQTEEVVNKLTSLPTLYIILPDFSRIFESWWNGFTDKLAAKFKDGQKSYGEDRDFSIGTKYAEDASNKANALLSENKENINTVGKNISGIRTAYEFLSSLPVIRFEKELVVVDIPMISDENVDKAIADFGKTADQWNREINSKKEMWSKLATKDGAGEKVLVDAGATVGSINAWVRFLDDTKRFPDKLYKYLTWKQRYADQILCNVEQIEQITGGYIAENGKRFRAWVELYVLLKAILKSWQLMVDLFYQHTNDCGVCRNERFDLKHFVFKIISAVIPKIPIIQFPKWPDIILDLHHIRLGLRILMPEFQFHISPFVLPHLPRLVLPSTPGLGIGLPTIPAPPKLPPLPDMPDIPSLPMIKLPDLPPPPKIPKLFSAITGVLQILKLVSQVLCILRKNPFVPEWRAGDQIAQITERQGKLPIDFLNVEFPNFPLAFIDAIRVTTFVNVEFQVDFILEMTKSTFQPINEFTTDLRSKVQNSVKDAGIKSTIDVSNTVPQGDTRIDVKGPQGMRQVPDISKMTVAERKAVMTRFALSLAYSFKELLAYVEREKKDQVAIGEFRKLVAEEALKLAGSNDAIVLRIAEVLGRAANYDGSEEDRLTQELLTDNREKFGIVKDAIRAEIREVEILKARIEEIRRGKTNDQRDLLGSLGQSAGEATLASSLESVGTDFVERGKALEKFEDRTVDRLATLADPNRDSEPSDLKSMGKELTGRVKDMTEESLRKEKALAAYAPTPEALLGPDAAEPISFGTGSASGTGTEFRFDADKEMMELAASTAASSMADSAVDYVYKGIYVLDQGKQSRLFDYVEELDGSEDALLFDMGKTGEGTEGVVYEMGNSLYFKQNLAAPDAPRTDDSVRVLELGDVLPTVQAPTAPNFFKEDFASPKQINFSFSPAKPEDRKFRLEFYDYVDRFDRIKVGSSGPTTPKRAVDLFADLAPETVVDASGTGVVTHKNVAYFDVATGEGDVTYPTYRTLSDGETIGISSNRTVYAGASSVTIRYAVGDQKIEEAPEITIPAHGNAEILAQGTIRVESGKLYLFGLETPTKTTDLSELRGLPILPGTKITMANPSSRIGIEYYDGSSYSLRGPSEYQAYDLGRPAEDYSVNVSQENDWYYARLAAFDSKNDNTTASLTLLSPQVQADNQGPLVEFPSNYRIPIYVKETVNLKRYVDDVSGIADTYVDVDPTMDRDGNSVANDDRDSDSAATSSGITKGADWSELVIGPFDAPKTVKVRLVATDENGNVTGKDVTITAYVPIPSITAASPIQGNGRIDVPVAGEPIDLFKFRGGRLSRLTGSGQTITDAPGNFVQTFQEGENVVVTQSGAVIANVDEKTGKIDLKSSGYSLSVRGASSSEPTTIAVSDASGKEVYWQSLALPATATIEKTDLFSSVSGSGMFVRMESGTDFVRNATNAPELPGGAFLVNEDRKAFAGIGKDGNVYLLQSGYSLTYKNEGEYPSYVVKNSFGVAVAQILIRLSAEFVIK